MSRCSPGDRALWLSRGRAEDDQGLRAGDPSATSDRVDHSLEVIKIRHPEAHKGIGVTGDREPLDEFGQVDERAVDVVDLGCAFEAELRERFDPIAELRVIDYGLVTQDDPQLLEPIDAALRSCWRETDLPSDVAC